MAAYTSAVNTFAGLLDGTSFNGTHDYVEQYSYVRVTINSQGSGTLLIHHSTNDEDVGLITETFAVYAGKPAVVSTTIKRAYIRVVFTPLTASTVNLVTKFVQRAVQPFLTYTTDEITTNVIVDLEGITMGDVSVTSTDQAPLITRNVRATTVTLNASYGTNVSSDRIDVRNYSQMDILIKVANGTLIGTGTATLTLGFTDATQIDEYLTNTSVTVADNNKYYIGNVQFNAPYAFFKIGGFSTGTNVPIAFTLYLR